MRRPLRLASLHLDQRALAGILLLLGIELHGERVRDEAARPERDVHDERDEQREEVEEVEEALCRCEMALVAF